VLQTGTDFLTGKEEIGPRFKGCKFFLLLGPYSRALFLMLKEWISINGKFSTSGTAMMSNDIYAGLPQISINTWCKTGINKSKQISNTVGDASLAIPALVIAGIIRASSEYET
jgi:hypothetical protein